MDVIIGYVIANLFVWCVAMGLSHKMTDSVAEAVVATIVASFIAIPLVFYEALFGDVE